MRRSLKKTCQVGVWKTEEREMEFLINNMECRPPPQPFDDRKVLQADQTLPQARRLPGSQQEDRALSDLERAPVFLLMRCQAFLISWGHSFTRLFMLMRCTVWQKIHQLDLLRSCGTSERSYRAQASPEQAYFPSFA
jgi:hypothetical protein